MTGSARQQAHCARQRARTRVTSSRRRWRRPATALALAACWLLFTAAARGAERQVSIGEIRWRGIEALSARELEARMISVRASWKPWVRDPPFDELVLQEDLERIAGLYRAHGYYDARIEYELIHEETRPRVDIEFSVVEGNPVILTERTIEWSDGELSPEQAELVLADLPLREGEIFSVFAYREAKQTLLERLADLGFPTATLCGGAEVDVEALAATVHWRIDTGPPVEIGAIEIRGTVDVDAELVRRELLFAEGDTYSRQALEATERAVYAIGLFRRVAVRALDPGDGGTVWPVEIEVEERDPRTVRLGVGYGTEDEFRASAAWTHRNFLGGARRLGLTGKYSSLVLGAGSRLVQPRFPERETESSIDLAFLRETPPAYDSKIVTAGLGFERPFGERWKGSASYRFEWGDVTNTTVESNRSEGETWLSFFRISAERSTLDEPIEPRSGTWLQLSIEPAFEGIGSDVNYVRLRAEGRWFHPLWRTTLATRVRLGTLQPFSGSDRDDVPVFKLFYSGGSRSVRGFEYQHLGPLDAQGEPEGGLTLAEATVELRFPIWRLLSGVVFVDTGQIGVAPFQLEAGGFLYSAGAGVRLRTPIGDVRVDYGHLLNRPPDVDPGRFYISVGQAF